MDPVTLEKIEFDAICRNLSGFCSTAPGKTLAFSTLPDREIDLVRRNLDETEEMFRVIRDIGIPPLAGLTDITDAVNKTSSGTGVTAEDFAAIASALDAAVNCRQFIESLPEDFVLLKENGGRISDFSSQLLAIRRVVAPDGTIFDSASRRLGELRGKIAKTTKQIHDLIHEYVQKPEIRKLLSDASVTLHEDRYVLPVRADNRGRLPGVVHRESNTGSTVFVEPAESVELNNLLADLHYHEKQEIARLLADLGIIVSKKKKAIITSLDTLAKLDLVAAKAQYAFQLKLIRPSINDRMELECYGARHPILDYQQFHSTQDGAETSSPKPVVPIDVRLGKDFDILIITGSNTGGKTVSLKTVALLGAMTQSGLFIPANKGATMPVFSDIMIDVGDEQSLQQSLSTFGGHIERLKIVLSRCRKDTLVLLDELGSGTDPDEGGALGLATLDELRSIGCLTMVTTHLSVLKAYAMNHNRVENASVEFDTETLQPLYRLQIGTPGESHAITVAEKLGLPGGIIDGARAHLADRGKEFRKALRRTGKARQKAEEALADAAAAIADAESRSEELVDRTADYEKLKSEFALWLHRLGELKKGDRILIPSTGKTGTLHRLELHRQVAVIDIDQIQMEVPLTDLMPDAGRTAIREELNSVRNRATQDRLEAQQLLENAKKHEMHLRNRSQQFDKWLNSLARLRVGQMISIARKPGKGKLTKIDFTALKATVEISSSGSDREVELSVQELFPQTGPFAGIEQVDRKPKRRGKDRPIPRRKKGRSILNVSPGEKVYLIPFNSTGTLVRIDREKDIAIVLRGAFEIELPLADVSPAKPK